MREYTWWAAESRGVCLEVVLERQVLAAHHPISLEPLAAELLGGSIGRVGPLDGDAVVVDALGRGVDGVAGDGHQHGLVRVEHSTRRIDSQALRVGGLDGPADATSSGIPDLDVVGVLVVEGSVEHDLGCGLRADVSGRK